MASEQDGLTNQKEILLQKLHYLREQYAIASDASQKFTLQMQIAEVEKEIEAIDVKMNIQDKTKMPDAVNVSKKSIANKKFDRKLFIKILITIITVLAALMGFVKDFRDFFFPPQEGITTITSPDSTNNEIKDSVRLDTPVIKNTESLPPQQQTSVKNQPVPKKHISVRLIVDIAYEKATIFANNVPIYPVNDAPLIKELSIEYNGKPIELIIKTSEKTCTHHITVSEDYFKNPQTIEKICAQ